MGGRLLTRWRTLCLASVLGAAGLASAQPGSPVPVVHVVPINGTIDLGLAPFLARAVREATEAGASAVVLEINTFGGRVDAVVARRDTLLNARIRTIAFVNPRAISAGALIALAYNTIILTTGGTIGAAAPVVAVVKPALVIRRVGRTRPGGWRLNESDARRAVVLTAVFGPCRALKPYETDPEA